ncbi:MAG: hypothetical protein HY560_04750 [Gemmatimonadetes bacterium]|nr:hypothetical protein [Gemmatimonadota bacterium]
MGYKVEQRQLAYRGRAFHFVSYKGKDAAPPMWFLMSSGTRWEVVEQVPGEELVELDRRLLQWLEHTLSGEGNGG